jgi:3-oxoacyl-[acyl-carrier-protein] synthase III
MRIQAIAATFPQRQLSNDQVIDLVAEHSRSIDPQWPRTQRVLGQALKATGAVSRRWREAGEASLDLVVSACQKALQDANHPSVDLLLYASVYPELVEPSSANRVAHALGLLHTECLDIKEACDGWMKAVKHRRCVAANRALPPNSGRQQRVSNDARHGRLA